MVTVSTKEASKALGPMAVTVSGTVTSPPQPQGNWTSVVMSAV